MRASHFTPLLLLTLAACAGGPGVEVTPTPLKYDPLIVEAATATVELNAPTVVQEVVKTKELDYSYLSTLAESMSPGVERDLAIEAANIMNGTTKSVKLSDTAETEVFPVAFESVLTNDRGVTTNASLFGRPGSRLKAYSLTTTNTYLFAMLGLAPENLATGHTDNAVYTIELKKGRVVTSGIYPFFRISMPSEIKVEDVEYYQVMIFTDCLKELLSIALQVENLKASTIYIEQKGYPSVAEVTDEMGKRQKKEVISNFALEETNNKDRYLSVVDLAGVMALDVYFIKQNNESYLNWLSQDLRHKALIELMRSQKERLDGLSSSEYALELYKLAALHPEYIGMGGVGGSKDFLWQK